MHSIVELLQLTDWRVTVSHMYREANQAADLLAIQGHGVALEISMVDKAFPALGLILLEDVVGGGIPRVIV